MLLKCLIIKLFQISSIRVGDHVTFVYDNIMSLSKIFPLFLPCRLVFANLMYTMFIPCLWFQWYTCFQCGSYTFSVMPVEKYNFTKQLTLWKCLQAGKVHEQQWKLIWIDKLLLGTKSLLNIQTLIF